MPTFVRLMIDRADGTRVAEVLDGPDLFPMLVGLVRPRDLERKLELAAHAATGTRRTTLVSALSRVRAETDSLFVSRVRATEGALPRRIGPPVQTPNRII